MYGHIGSHQPPCALPMSIGGSIFQRYTAVGSDTLYDEVLNPEILLMKVTHTSAVPVKSRCKPDYRSKACLKPRSHHLRIILYLMYGNENIAL